MEKALSPEVCCSILDAGQEVYVGVGVCGVEEEKVGKE